jgi:hypothetical protein
VFVDGIGGAAPFPQVLAIYDFSSAPGRWRACSASHGLFCHSPPKRLFVSNGQIELEIGVTHILIRIIGLQSNDSQ